jgi:PAS domain S-box-containing protein
MMTSGISQLKIGPRLILGFTAIILLMLVRSSVLAWQFGLVTRQSDRVTALAQELAVVSRFHTDLLSIDEKLDSFAKAEDVEGMTREAGHSRSILVADIEAIRDAMAGLPSDVRGDEAPLATVEAVETIWSPQLDAVIALGNASDWNVVRLRLADEKRPLEGRASDLVRTVQQHVTDALVQSVAQSERVKRRILFILYLTGFLTLLLATLLGIAITRSITVPLRQLWEGSTALARGDFDYQVELRGRDELADVGAVFNETSAKLGDLYGKLQEAQRISHVGYWIWDLETNRLTWPDETYRIFGLEPQELPIDVSRFLQMVHPEDRELLAQATRDAVGGASPTDVEFRIIRPSGEVRTVHSRGSVKRNALGSLHERFGTVQDITERKQAERALQVLSRDLQDSKVKLEEAQRIAHVGYWERDLVTGRITWSDETYRIFGLRPQERSMDLAALEQSIHPQDWKFVSQALAQALAGGARYNVDYRLLRPSGEVRFVHSNGDVKRDASGRPSQMFGTVQDITERKRAEEALRRSQFYLSEGQRLAHMGSWAFNSAGYFDYWSPEMFRVYGLDSSGKAPTSEEHLALVHPEDRNLVARTMRNMLEDHSGFDITFRIVRPKGSARYIRCVGTPATEGGTFQGFVGTGIDVTEQQRLEQERERLRQVEAELAHTNRLSMLGEMAASLAHEIKQPIAAAITSANSCLEWLTHEPPNLDRARAAARKIDKYGNRAAEIIDRIRSFYRKSPPHRELVDVNGIIREILTLLEGEATRSSVAMRTELTSAVPEILADRVQLQQVLMNLMLNAIEAMEHSGGELTTKSELLDGQLLVSISDTGVGLPGGSADRIFSAFFTTKSEGSGMGLAISRTIVESHGGRLWAASHDGPGATFHFTLPVSVTESTAVI